MFFHTGKQVEEIFDIRKVLDPKKFIELIRGENTTMDILREFAPNNVEGYVKNATTNDEYPHFMSSFNVNSLNKKQQEALKLHMMVKK